MALQTWATYAKTNKLDFGQAKAWRKKRAILIVKFIGADQGYLDALGNYQCRQVKYPENEARDRQWWNDEAPQRKKRKLCWPQPPVWKALATRDGCVFSEVVMQGLTR